MKEFFLNTNRFKKPIFAFLFLLSYLVGIKAQSPTTIENGVARLNQINRGVGLIPVFNHQDNEVRGSRFFNDTYTEGEVWLSNNRYYSKEYKYKFDEADNTIQVITDKGKEIQLLPFEVEIAKLVIKGSTITYFRAEVPNSNGIHRLFQALFVGKRTTLIKLPGKKLVKTDKTGGYNTGEIYQEYIPVHRYFLQVDNKPFQEVKMTKRSLTKAMPHKKSVLEEYFEYHEGEVKDYEIVELLASTEKKGEDK